MDEEIDFVEIIRDLFLLDTMSSSEKFAKAGYYFMKYNRGGLKYSAFIEHFELLEEEIGELPSISIIENLSNKNKEKYYEYFLTEFIQMAFNTFAQMITFMINKSPFQKTETEFDSIMKELSDILTNEQIISSYIKEWEFNYNIFVKPIFQRLGKLGHLPMKKEKYRHWEIEQVSKFLKSKEHISHLTFLLEPLDTTMRNAFVHLDYFIDNENRTITIINRNKKCNNCTESSFDDLVMRVIRLKVNRLVHFVLISRKLSNKLGMDWKV